MRTAMILLMGCCGMAATTAAWADGSPLLSGNAQFMTNYVGRGLAQSLGNPSVEGELDVNNDTDGGFYGGNDANSMN